MKNNWITFICLFIITLSSLGQKDNPLIGKWDLNIEFQGKTAPSWLEVYKSGNETLVGRFVFAFGSARPIAEVKTHDNQFWFDIPNQWEPKGNNMMVNGKIENKELKGTIVYTDGSIIPFTGVPAPKMEFNDNPSWGKTISLFNGKNLDGWHFDNDNAKWKVDNGYLINENGGANLISDALFKNFKLLVEFKYPEGSNSGIYLRGRHEVQIEDNYGLETASTKFGGVYGFLTPNQNAALPANEWQRFEIHLVGSLVTIIANNKEIIKNQNIPGITGGALDSNEGAAGPIMIQGDHGPITFRKIEITPAQ